MDYEALPSVTHASTFFVFPSVFFLTAIHNVLSMFAQIFFFLKKKNILGPLEFVLTLFPLDPMFPAMSPQHPKTQKHIDLNEDDKAAKFK